VILAGGYQKHGNAIKFPKDRLVQGSANGYGSDASWL